MALASLSSASVPTAAAASTFPNVGVSLDFLISILESDVMITPMHLLAGISRADMDAKDLSELRDLCKEYHVLGTAGMPDTLEYSIYDGKIPKSKQFFVEALCQLPTTMQHVFSFIVQPQTKELNGSYAEKILKLRPSSEQWVGTATDFCSHVWKSSFQNFVESLIAEAAQRGSNEPRYYWNDIWVLDYTKPAPNYFETFRTAIPTIGRTMLVMGSLKNAKPLTRAWCVWEIFCTINAGCELAVVMPPSARVELKHMLTHHFKDVIKILMSVKSEKSEARFQSDKDTIFQIIREECEGGFGGVDGVICEGLRGWLSSEALRNLPGR